MAGYVQFLASSPTYSFTNPSVMNEHIHFIMAIITANGCSVPLFVVLVSSCLLIILSNEHAYHITIFPVHDFLLIQVIYIVDLV